MNSKSSVTINHHIVIGLAMLIGLFSGPKAFAQSGELLFRIHCNACHHVPGKGGIGIPLSNSKLATIDDQYLITTMLLGRPGRIMPPFKEVLDLPQMQQIIDYLRDHSGAQAPELQNLTIAGDASVGKVLYEARCIECHGAGGKSVFNGMGVEINTGTEPGTVPVSLDNIGFQRAASDAMLNDVILNGREDSKTHAYSQLGISPSDAGDLITYIRSFGQTDGEKNTTQPDAGELQKQPLSYVVESPYDFDTTLENIKMAISSNNFRVFPERYLEQGLVEGAQVNQKQVVLRFCNFSNLFQLLKIDPRIGSAMPCQITLLETDKGVLITSMNPIAMATMFNNAELTKFAKEVDETIRWVMEEATL